MEPQKHRFAALDGWRGACALLVAIFHMPTGGHFDQAMLTRNAWLFVDFFFVLSGFVISYSAEAKLGAPGAKADFLQKRVARLWPLHFITLAAMIGLECIRSVATHGGGFPPERTIAEIPPNLLLIHGWGGSDYLTWNWPSWSVSVELAAYILFVGFVMLPRSARIPVATAAVLGALFALSRLSTTFMYSGPHLGILRGVAGFFTGYLTYRIWQTWRPRTGTGLEVLAVAGVVAFVSLCGATAWSYAAPLVFGAAVLVFAGGSGRLSKALESPAGLSLGAWSYSIYLTQAPIIVFLRMAYQAAHLPGHLGSAAAGLHSMGAADLIVVAYLALVCGVSALTYRFVELPGKQILAPRRQVQQVPPRKIVPVG